jgi:hypothetical protein
VRREIYLAVTDGKKGSGPEGADQQQPRAKPVNKEVPAQNDRPWRGRSSARFEEIDGPLLGVRSVMVTLIYRGLPSRETRDYYWTASPGRGAVPPPN